MNKPMADFFIWDDEKNGGYIVEYVGCDGQKYRFEGCTRGDCIGLAPVGYKKIVEYALESMRNVQLIMRCGNAD
jgi:hypothetical protein